MIGKKKVFLAHTETSRDVSTYVNDSLVNDVESLAIFEFGKEESSLNFHSIIAAVKNADLCIFDLSEPNTGIGTLIAEALMARSQVIAIYKKGVTPEQFILGINNKEYTLFEYDTALDAIKYIRGLLGRNSPLR